MEEEYGPSGEEDLESVLNDKTPVQNNPPSPEEREYIISRTMKIGSFSREEAERAYEEKYK